LGSFFNISEKAQIFWATVFHRARNELILTGNGLGYILGDLKENQSGHPG
jgi:hypothetical protein